MTPHSFLQFVHAAADNPEGFRCSSVRCLLSGDRITGAYFVAECVRKGSITSSPDKLASGAPFSGVLTVS